MIRNRRMIVSKGSKRRPKFITDEQEAANWDAIKWRNRKGDKCWCGADLIECETKDGKRIKACPECLRQQVER